MKTEYYLIIYHKKNPNVFYKAKVNCSQVLKKQKKTFLIRCASAERPRGAHYFSFTIIYCCVFIFGEAVFVLFR
uniref:Uncharacterized protein n=1 Tax=Anguilla anguilla TaxID=7936 RepID=A0A0E9X7J6_ANGAN